MHAMNRRIFLCTIAWSILLALPALASAQTNSTNFFPLANYQGSTPLQTAFTSKSLPQYFNALFSIAITVGAMAAVLRLVWAGYLYMGSDIWAQKNKAKQVVTDTIIGLLLLLAVYLILFQINPCILNLNVLRDVGSSASSSSCPTN